MRGMNGEAIEVQTIELIDDILEVVDLDVEDVDNYFAGEIPVLVHNSFGK